MSAGKVNFITTEAHRCNRMLAKDSLSTSETLYWVGSVPVNSRSYLQDHRVTGTIIYPAAAFSIAGIQVHQALRKSGNKQESVVLKDLKFRRALPLSFNDSTVLRLGYYPDLHQFIVCSQRSDHSDSPILHAGGKLALAGLPPPVNRIELSEILRRCHFSLDTSDFYQRLHQSGLDYGPFFQRIVSLQVSRYADESITQLAAHPDLDSFRDPWAQSVTLLDSAFQTLAATLDTDSTDLYVPMQIKTLCIHGDFSNDLWCYARQVSANARSVTGDIVMFDSSGRTLVEVNGLRCLKKPDIRPANTKKNITVGCRQIPNYHYPIQRSSVS